MYYYQLCRSLWDECSTQLKDDSKIVARTRICAGSLQSATFCHWTQYWVSACLWLFDIWSQAFAVADRVRTLSALKNGVHLARWIIRWRGSSGDWLCSHSMDVVTFAKWMLRQAVSGLAKEDVDSQTNDWLEIKQNSYEERSIDEGYLYVSMPHLYAINRIHRFMMVSLSVEWRIDWTAPRKR